MGNKIKLYNRPAWVYIFILIFKLPILIILYLLGIIVDTLIEIILILVEHFKNMIEFIKEKYKKYLKRYKFQRDLSMWEKEKRLKIEKSIFKKVSFDEEEHIKFTKEFQEWRRIKGLIILLLLMTPNYFLFMPNYLYAQQVNSNTFFIGDIDRNILYQSDYVYLDQINTKSNYGLGISSVFINNKNYRTDYGINLYGEYNREIWNSELFSRILLSNKYNILYDYTFNIKPIYFLKSSFYSSRDVSGILIDSKNLFVVNNGFSTDLIIRKFTMVNSINQMYFSDNNSRTILVNKIHLDQIPKLSFTFENRIQNSEEKEVSYFSPKTYTRHTAEIRSFFVAKNEHHVFRPSVIYGWEFINRGDKKTVYGVSFGGRSNLGSFGFDYKMSYVKSANNFGSYDMILFTLKSRTKL